ncbi:hypothetical protein [Clostridium sp.]|uniref:hypothetical protein n=1 Tax=Clostridium sp. TaxID=1506 RepID=UPI0029131056|nr:hypothetical protein [Clostridium sp.]MDU7243346.1 hypothetical protein [Clostridium sp.]
MGQIKIKELLVRIMKAWIEDREITEKNIRKKKLQWITIIYLRFIAYIRKRI